jgi:putative restriction endonuclease
MSEDADVRRQAFQFLEEQSRLHGDELPYSVLNAGFSFRGTRVPLLGPQGIFKPAVCQLPLTINTAPPKSGKPKPYDDSLDEKGFLLYRYRGVNPQHHENVGLRRAMQTQTPLIYLHGISPGNYLAAFPVFVVGDNPTSLTFTVAVDDAAMAVSTPASAVVDPEVEGRRRYVTAVVLRRLHQQSFRERVLEAYRTQCAVCRLKHKELLDAAHIVPDSAPRGEPAVSNGLALCKLHHAAFDGNFFGVRPDSIVEVRSSILAEEDGLMLRYGLQSIHGSALVAPRSESQKPAAELLEARYAQFRKAS